MAHAEDEALAARAAVEQAHSAACVRLHDPSQCVSCRALSTLASAGTRYSLPATTSAWTQAPSLDQNLSPKTHCSDLPVARAPPSSH